ncbi:hypothetical protein [Burkholderia pseudomallei]|uniref:hypothetical protein n=1 Tax=Burkholderia pseudomallei TaxID=28450 RepID=UPI0018A6B9E6|nr:hypothetical protein [Burkholderia pseudomallei]
MNPYLTGRRCALASVDGRLTLDCMKRTGGLPGKKRDCSSESDHARRCAPACPISPESRRKANVIPKRSTESIDKKCRMIRLFYPCRRTARLIARPCTIRPRRAPLWRTAIMPIKPIVGAQPPSAAPAPAQAASIDAKRETVGAPMKRRAFLRRYPCIDLDD